MERLGIAMIDPVDIWIAVMTTHGHKLEAPIFEGEEYRCINPGCKYLKNRKRCFCNYCIQINWEPDGAYLKDIPWCGAMPDAPDDAAWRSPLI